MSRHTRRKRIGVTSCLHWLERRQFDVSGADEDLRLLVKSAREAS
jgi:hypothetical protein